VTSAGSPGAPRGAFLLPYLGTPRRPSSSSTSKRQARIADLMRAVRTRAAPERGWWNCSECGCSKAEADRLA